MENQREKEIKPTKTWQMSPNVIKGVNIKYIKIKPKPTNFPLFA